MGELLKDLFELIVPLSMIIALIVLIDEVQNYGFEHLITITATVILMTSGAAIFGEKDED